MKFGAVEQVHTRFVLWSHMLLVHHSALTDFRFTLFVNLDARHKCPHTRSSPGQHEGVSSHDEHFCCRCICFNYNTLKIEISNLLTSSVPKHCNPTSNKHERKQSWEGRKSCYNKRCSAASFHPWVFTHSIYLLESSLMLTPLLLMPRRCLTHYTSMLALGHPSRQRSSHTPWYSSTRDPFFW